MSSADCLEQKGVIEHIDKGLASIRLASFTACAGCHSKSLCGVSEDEARKVSVVLPDSSYSIGEPVVVGMKRQLGMRATFYAYIMPFILVISFLVLFTSLHIKELFSGLLALLSLVPYYTCLFLFRHRLSRTFTFTLRKAV